MAKLTDNQIYDILTQAQDIREFNNPLSKYNREKYPKEYAKALAKKKKKQAKKKGK